MPSDPPFMPTLFLGHGSLLNALEDNAFSRAWDEENQLQVAKTPSRGLKGLV